MAKKPDVPCARCGVLLWSGPSSAPPGARVCQPCRRIAPSRPAPRKVRVVCPGCSGEFKPDRKTDRFCSSRCRNRLNGKSKPHDSHRSRARYFGVPYESVSAKQIYERDGWRCGLCRLKVDRDLAFPDPLSASLDHVIPLSVPGSPGHVRANVQLAHLGCNIRKGAGGGGEQLALIG